MLQSLSKNKEETNTGQEFIVDIIEQSNNPQSARECDRGYSAKLKVRLIYLQFSEKVNRRLLG